jgi:hypothetical protein
MPCQCIVGKSCDVDRSLEQAKLSVACGLLIALKVHCR